jgi:hypothetical protein
MKNSPHDATSRQVFSRRDAEYWQELEKLVAENKISFSEVLTNFSAFVRRRELTRVLAYYDLFRMVDQMPGSIVELGVYLGAGLLLWSKLLETFVPGDRSRKVFGFESGGGYEVFCPEDGDPRPWLEAVGPKTVDIKYLQRLSELANKDNLIPGAERCRVIYGNITDTVPEFSKTNQGIRLSILFLDVNLYRPTLIGLRELYPLVQPGGIVALNGYGAPPWLGEAVALEHYFSELSTPIPRLRKFNHSIWPGAFFVKA